MESKLRAGCRQLVLLLLYLTVQTLVAFTVLVLQLNLVLHLSLIFAASAAYFLVALKNVHLSQLSQAISPATTSKDRVISQRPYPRLLSLLATCTIWITWSARIRSYMLIWNSDYKAISNQKTKKINGVSSPSSSGQLGKIGWLRGKVEEKWSKQYLGRWELLSLLP